MKLFIEIVLMSLFVIAMKESGIEAGSNPIVLIGGAVGITFIVRKLIFKNKHWVTGKK